MFVGNPVVRSVLETPYSIWHSSGSVSVSTQASAAEMGAAWLQLHELAVTDPFDHVAAQRLIDQLLKLAEADGSACWNEYLVSKANAEEDEEFEPYDRDIYLHRIEQELHNLSLERDTFVRANDFAVKTAASYNALLVAMGPVARHFFEDIVMNQKAQEMLHDWQKTRDKSSIAWVKPMTANLLAAYRAGLSKEVENQERHDDQAASTSSAKIPLSSGK